MKAPQPPNNEEARLQSLRSLGVLDTPPEERFDRVTRMAKRLFQVPIALVSLVDENRQWFKSCMGLEASETPRDISFCGHAILGDETFVISDTSLDSRFSDNPLVTGAPHIRFYAGHPLSAPTGEKMGTLCIIDTKPKQLDQEDLLALQDLATMVEQELAAVQMATLDELTDISNRRGFIHLAQHSLNLSKRLNTPCALVYFDLDNFKPINDQYGHAEGDRALQIFTNQMKKSFRDSDVFTRIGGDEFVALLNSTSKATAQNIIRRFEESLNDHTASIALDYNIEFSYGLVQYDASQHESIDQLLDSADKTMYQYKNKSKNN